MLTLGGRKHHNRSTTPTDPPAKASARAREDAAGRRDSDEADPQPLAGVTWGSLLQQQKAGATSNTANCFKTADAPRPEELKPHHPARLCVLRTRGGSSRPGNTEPRSAARQGGRGCLLPELRICFRQLLGRPRSLQHVFKRSNKHSNSHSYVPTASLEYFRAFCLKKK